MLGRHDEAAPLLQRALNMREKSYGADHPEVAVSLHNLASNGLDRRDWERTYRLFKRASEIWITRQTRSSAATPSDGPSEVTANTDPFLGLIISAFEMRQVASGPAPLNSIPRPCRSPVGHWVESRERHFRNVDPFCHEERRSWSAGAQAPDLAEQALAVDRALIAAVSFPAGSQRRGRQRYDAICWKSVQLDADAALGGRSQSMRL
jgi:hypothetical protein